MVLELLGEGTPLERCQAALPLLSAADLGAYDFRPQPMALAASRILRRMALFAYGAESTFAGESIAAALQRALAPTRPDARSVLTTALIVCADHELNVSSFAARCVASAGSPPYAVVSAGLAALQGVKHGGMCGRVEALLREAGDPGQAERTVADRIRRGEAVPGFGHPLYPAGDPRGRLLLSALNARYPDTTGLRLAGSLAAAARSAGLEAPNIDFALAALCAALSLPPGSALTLFALGRTIGWLAHAIEAYQSNQLIRPRAHYVGVPPNLAGPEGGTAEGRGKHTAANLPDGV